LFVEATFSIRSADASLIICNEPSFKSRSNSKYCLLSSLIIGSSLKNTRNTLRCNFLASVITCVSDCLTNLLCAVLTSGCFSFMLISLVCNASFDCFTKVSASKIKLVSS